MPFLIYGIYGVWSDMTIPRDSRHHLLLWLVACSEALWRLTHLTSKQDWVKTDHFFFENVQKTHGEITTMCRGESCKLSLQSVLWKSVIKRDKAQHITVI